MQAKDSKLTLAILLLAKSSRGKCMSDIWFEIYRSYGLVSVSVLIFDLWAESREFTAIVPIMCVICTS